MLKVKSLGEKMELHWKLSNGDHVLIISEGEFNTLVFGLNAIIHGYGENEPEVQYAKVLRARLQVLQYFYDT